MDPLSILTLISELYATVGRLTKENAELRETLAERSDA